MEKYNILFESFNKAVNEYFEKHEKENGKRAQKLVKSGEKDQLVDFIAQAVNNVQGIALAWENTPIKELDNQTPKEFIDSINDLESMINAFKVGAKIVDIDLPSAFLQKLKSFSDNAIDSLLDLAQKKSLHTDGTGNEMISVTAIRVLSIWNTEKIVKPLIELMYKNEESDLILEAISSTLTENGPSSLELIVEALENADKINVVEEYLYSVLSRLGSENKSDRVYRCLKSTFLKMDNKVIGALCVADYGDGRIIPALRGYAEKNRDTLDRETLYEIKYAVEKLGGSMDDLNIGSRRQ